MSTKGCRVRVHRLRRLVVQIHLVEISRGSRVLLLRLRSRWVELRLLLLRQMLRRGSQGVNLRLIPHTLGGYDTQDVIRCMLLDQSIALRRSILLVHHSLLLTVAVILTPWDEPLSPSGGALPLTLRVHFLLVIWMLLGLMFEKVYQSVSLFVMHWVIEWSTHSSTNPRWRHPCIEGFINLILLLLVHNIRVWLFPVLRRF